MARNASGTYTAPTGNPVVTGTTISSTVHNNTITDIGTELTDSLSRSGKGPMLAPLEATDGTVALPSITFDSDPDSGLYRIGANNIGVAVNAAKVLDVATTGLGVTGTLAATGAVSGTTGTFTGVVKGPDGAVGAPAYSFTSDTDTGWYLGAAGDARLAVAGADHLGVTTTLIDAKSKKISNVTDPASAQDAATKNYVDTVSTTTVDLTGVGWTASTNDVRRSGKVVMVNLVLTFGGAAVFTNMGTLPTGYRPPVPVTGRAQATDAGTATYEIALSITTLGVIGVSALGAQLDAAATWGTAFTPGASDSIAFTVMFIAA